LNIARQVTLWRVCRKWPDAARKVIRDINAKMLPAGYVDEHFNPPYDPWDQRMCIVPDGDLFRVIREGTASVVTGHIETFTAHGVLLKDGRELEADIIVTATGLNMQTLGGMTLDVDGTPVQAGDRFVYKGMMLSDSPNFVFMFGYTNASWTLKVGLVGEHFCRLLSYMDAHGYGTVTPIADPGMPTAPFTSFDPGYIRRALDRLPRQGDRAPWRISPTYNADVKLLRQGPVDDPELRFEGIHPAAPGITPVKLAGNAEL
jgi:cation diffusion facilitator CzcD-associated flavoprotein CzcO